MLLAGSAALVALVACSVFIVPLTAAAAAVLLTGKVIFAISAIVLPTCGVAIWVTPPVSIVQLRE